MSEYAHTHFSHCAFHLGDNLMHLHFLRSMAIHHPDSLFVHGVEPCHIPQLIEVVEDIQNVKIIPIDERPTESVDAWKNAGGFWEKHPKRWDFSGFYLEFFRHKSAELGQESPFNHPFDLFFDYPALKRPVNNLPSYFDFLIVNSRPCSGQLLAYDRLEYFDPLIEALAKRWHVLCTQKTEIARVWCTQDFGLTISQIGAVSSSCRAHIMVATGPMWPTINVNNRTHAGYRVALLGNGERLNLPFIAQMENINEVMEFSKQRGWIQ